MANQNIFGSAPRNFGAPAADVVNNAGGKAYSFTHKHALAQIAATNCFNGTFYASATDNYKIAKEAVDALKGEPEFLAKVAVYARHKAYMKDMPAYLTAVLAATPGVDRTLFRRTFRKVIDNGKMLRNFVQIGRSGGAGKVLNMSSGSVRSAIQEWFDSKSPDAIFRASVGNNPSLKDIIKMARPKPEPRSAKAALLAYLIDTPFNEESQCFEQKRRGADGNLYVAHSDPWENLPQLVREYNLFKKHPLGTPPNVEFRLLTGLTLNTAQWTEIARNAGWQMTRMNLETFARHGVFKDKSMVKMVADRLRNPMEIAKAKAFPYQLLMAYRATGPAPTHYFSSFKSLAAEEENVPNEIREALQDAMEIATDNVPTIDGKIYIAVDVSGSMQSPVTGERNGSTSKVRCVDAAALFAATIMRKNRSAEIWPFDGRLHGNGHDLNGRDAIMTNAEKLAKYGGGSTDCSLVINQLNQREVCDAKAVIYISDYESWIDPPRGNGLYHAYGRGTALMTGWKQFERRNPQAKLICMDLTPRDNGQVSPQSNILQVGGFSDQVFDVIASFLSEGQDSDHWVRQIEAVDI